MADRKDKPVECYVLRDGRTIPSCIAEAGNDYSSRYHLRDARAVYSMYDLLDGKCVDDAISALKAIKKAHGDVQFDVQAGEYEGDSACVFITVKRPMNADEHLRWGEIQLERKRKTEERERQQYEALKARFEGGKK